MSAPVGPVEILGVGAVTPVGLTARTTAAAIRAGVTRVQLTSIYNRAFEPLKAAFLDEGDLAPLHTALASRDVPLAHRHQRMLRIAGPALREAVDGAGPLPLVLALPEPLPGGRPADPAFLEHLAVQAGVALSVGSCRVVSAGRAGGLWAAAQALELLATTQGPGVLVGGVDTYLDLRRLSTLDAEGRLRGDGPSDGFIPGEGAAFVWLARAGTGARLGRAPVARLAAVGTGSEEGHLDSDEPYRGDGLSQAFGAVFRQWRTPQRRVEWTFGGLNGESFWAKEWGVAQLRHAEHFGESARMEHPIENIGDPGAALGPLLLTLGALSLHRGYRPGPVLVWCSSDRSERGAAIIEPGGA